MKLSVCWYYAELNLASVFSTGNAQKFEDLGQFDDKIENTLGS